ncbi:MAG TPA: hypothetical protein VFI76_03585 [Terrimicrobiaceae bacterium]|nr:hypothetical protein [Terrimicrobiaceae bacterium]
MIARHRKLIRAMGLPLIALAMFSVGGGHWAILQTIAWAGMLRDFAREGPLTTAIIKTFSGENPCKLCLKVEEGRQKEDAPVSIKSDRKGESFLCAENSAAQWPIFRDFSYPTGPCLAWIQRLSSPPFPPPRLTSA